MVVLAAVLGALLGFTIASYAWSKYYSAERYVALVDLHLKVKKFLHAETTESAADMMLDLVDASAKADMKSRRREAVL